MKEKNAVLEMTKGKERLTFPGPGGYTIQWAPGARHLPLESAPSGHLMIPCAEFAKVQKTSGLQNSSVTFHATSNDQDQATCCASDGDRVTSSSRPVDSDCMQACSSWQTPATSLERCATGDRVTSFRVLSMSAPNPLSTAEQAQHHTEESPVLHSRGQ